MLYMFKDVKENINIKRNYVKKKMELLKTKI